MATCNVMLCASVQQKSDWSSPRTIVPGPAQPIDAPVPIEALADAPGPLTIPAIREQRPELAQSSAYRNLVVLEQANVVHLGDLLNNRGYPNVDAPAGASVKRKFRPDLASTLRPSP